PDLAPRIADPTGKPVGAGHRHHARGWLQSGDPAVAGRHPDAAARVAPDAERRTAGGDYGRFAAAAPSRRTVDVVGIASAAVAGVPAVVSDDARLAVGRPGED